MVLFVVILSLVVYGLCIGMVLDKLSSLFISLADSHSLGPLPVSYVTLRNWVSMLFQILSTSGDMYIVRYLTYQLPGDLSGAAAPVPEDPQNT